MPPRRSRDHPRSGLRLAAAALLLAVGGWAASGAFGDGGPEPRWEVPAVVFWRTPLAGDGELVTQEVPLPATTGLSLRLPFPATVRRVAGAVPRAIVTMDRNLLPLLVVERDDDGVNRGTLDVRLAGPCRSWAPAGIELIVPHLQRLATYGPAAVHVAGLDGGPLDHLHFAGTTVTLAGRLDHYLLRVYGAGDVDAGDLTSARTDVQVLGAGDVRLAAPAVLRARLYGSGDVVCAGEPREVDVDRFGRGRLSTGPEAAAAR